MTDDVRFRFGNMPVVEGRGNVREFVSRFFNSIRAIRHDPLEIWEAEGTWLMNGRVTYTRHNGTELRVYFSNTFKMSAGRIRDYFIFVDTPELYRA